MPTCRRGRSFSILFCTIRGCNGCYRGRLRCAFLVRVLPTRSSCSSLFRFLPRCPRWGLLRRESPFFLYWSHRMGSSVFLSLGRCFPSSSSGPVSKFRGEFRRVSPLWPRSLFYPWPGENKVSSPPLRVLWGWQPRFLLILLSISLWNVLLYLRSWTSSPVPNLPMRSVNHLYTKLPTPILRWVPLCLFSLSLLGFLSSGASSSGELVFSRCFRRFYYSTQDVLLSKGYYAGQPRCVACFMSFFYYGYFRYLGRYVVTGILLHLGGQRGLIRGYR